MKYPAHPALTEARRTRNLEDAKTCTVCGVEKQFKDFNFGGYHDGFEKKCKACAKQQYAEKMSKIFGNVPPPAVIPPTPPLDLTSLMAIAQQLINFIQKHQ